MSNIKYFWEQAFFSVKKGKFYYRPWKQLTQIILLELGILLLTEKI